MDLFADQIVKYIRKDNVQRVVRDIRRLASLPAGRERAMRLLVLAAQSWCCSHCDSFCAADTGRSGHEELSPMEALMEDMIRAQYLDGELE